MTTSLNGLGRPYPWVACGRSHGWGMPATLAGRYSRSCTVALLGASGMFFDKPVSFRSKQFSRRSRSLQCGNSASGQPRIRRHEASTAMRTTCGLFMEKILPVLDERAILRFACKAKVGSRQRPPLQTLCYLACRSTTILSLRGSSAPHSPVNFVPDVVRPRSFQYYQERRL